MPQYIVNTIDGKPTAALEGRAQPDAPIRVRGTRQPDGSILAPNGSTWIVGKRS